MKSPHPLKNALHFKPKELLGAGVVIAVVIAFAIYPFLKNNNSAGNPQITDSSTMASIAELKNNKPPEKQDADENVAFYQNDRRTESRNDRSPIAAGALFAFDPNTLDESGWRKLGLRDRTIRTILNYRGKGGQFRKPDDLQKIYGLHKDEFERLKPYIVIASPSAGSSQQHYSSTNTSFSERPVYERKKPQSIDINAADTTAYITLPGIGSKLAARIVNFREKLGGFYSVEQVGETFGVPPETFEAVKPYLQLKGGTVRKMNVNTAGYDELNAHPYISSKLAYLINKQRKTGPITNPEALKELVAQTNDNFEKVEHYISFQ